ncbi:hypothetical protein [Pseudarthrobacter sulfonivorans]|uniref:hypothetical protein n=1 Tax=Pseudarthrobacter sulfonivorans TaxID=121292 RepID=UPI002104FF08|nr:hypothetical protein [Pseudarthrobacter sulfonivorans]
MVIHRSEPSRAQTNVQGGLRRGGAAAALGVALVLSAGVPASHAVEGNDTPGRPAHVQVSLDDSVIGGVLRGLQNGSASRSNAGTAPSEPAPASASAAPASAASSRPSRPSDPDPTTPARPSDPATPTPTPVAPAPASPTSPASPTAPATAPQDVPTQGSPSPGTATQGAAAPSAAATPTNTPNGSAADGMGLDRSAGARPGARTGRGAETARQEPGEQGPQSVASQSPAPTADETTAGAAVAAGHPTAAAAPSAHHEMTDGGPAPETTKVWLGVGLVGSAGAAGLVFARIRKF